MPALNFKERFADDVRFGIKRQTVRAPHSGELKRSSGATSQRLCAVDLNHPRETCLNSML